MKAVRRIRRKMLGAKVEVRLYEDGSMRLRVDHPSNDPGLEIAIAGSLISTLGARPSGPMTWKDDPA